MTFRRPLVFLVLSLMPAAIAAGIGLTPPYVNVVVPRGGTVSETVSLFSTSSEQQPLGVSKGDWIQDDAGNLTFLPSGQDPYSASAWVALSSEVVTVPAKKGIEYRYSVHVPAKSSLSGTYKTVLFFETQPKRPSDQGRALVTRQRLGFILYVTVAGTARPSLGITDFYREGQNVVLALANSGNVVTRLGGKVDIRNREGKTVASIAVPSVPVQRGGTRTLSLPLPKGLKPGVYVALALVKPDNTAVQAGQLQFQLP